MKILRRCLLVIMVSLFSFHAIAQMKSTFTYAAVHKIEKRDSYSVFYPADKENFKGVIIIIHSDQASNPKSYGNMIEHFIQQDYLIIYPAYQDFVVSKKKHDIPFISKSISKAYSDIEKNYEGLMSLPVAIIGHSMGGIISLELAAGSGLLPKKPSCVISLAPAEVRYHRLRNLDFKKLDSYDVYLIIEEKKDKYYKRSTGNKIIDNLAFAKRKKHLIHPGGELGKSKHMNAWSHKAEYSSRNNSLLSYFSKMIGKTNAVDEKFYWPAMDKALDCAFSREGCEYFRN